MRGFRAAGSRLHWLLILLAAHRGDARANEVGWIDLTAPPDWSAGKPPTGDWTVAGSVRTDPTDPKRRASTPGTGVIVNGPIGTTRNLVSQAKFGDVEAHVEFLVPKGSNSGVKFEALYEIQIFDSWGVKQAKAS